MYRIAFVMILLLGIALESDAQDEPVFVFDNNPRALDLSSVAPEEVKEHPLGEEVAKKLELLKMRYTYIEPAGPTSPVDKTVVIKPVIYNSILKLNRFYKSEFKSEHITLTDAQKQLLNCLDVALIIYADNTDDFERYLKKIRDPEEIVKAYGRVVLQ